jgi:anti-sigma-K factor RskA
MLSLRPWGGWAAAAGLALAATWLGILHVSSRSEASLLRDTQALSAVSLKIANQQLEAEQILAQRQLSLHRDQVAALNQRVDSLNARTAALTSQLQREGDLAALKITALSSLLKNSPQALAVAVWSDQKQAGILKVEKLPALAPDQDYQLWVVDPQYPNPVDGGVFVVDAQTGDASIQFHSKQRVNAVNAFAVTLERKGGVPKAEGPFVLLGK